MPGLRYGISRKRPSNIIPAENQSCRVHGGSGAGSSHLQAEPAVGFQVKTRTGPVSKKVDTVETTGQVSNDDFLRRRGDLLEYLQTGAIGNRGDVAPDPFVVAAGSPSRKPARTKAAGGIARLVPNCCHHETQHRAEPDRGRSTAAAIVEGRRRLTTGVKAGRHAISTNATANKRRRRSNETVRRRPDQDGDGQCENDPHPVRWLDAPVDGKVEDRPNPQRQRFKDRKQIQ